MSYPNYRISVELIFLNEGKILLTKRSENSKVAPGVWNVPAGKLKYDEIPIQAVHRESMEETGLKLGRIEELSVRNQSWKSNGEYYFRVIFTYLVEAEQSNYHQLKLNNEHTDYTWVNFKELSHEDYESVHPELRKIIAEKIFKQFNKVSKR